MRYELELVVDLSEELALGRVAQSPSQVTIELEPGVVLGFLNFDDEDDCLMGFEGTEWHTHDGLMLANRNGQYVELTYLDVLTGLADGTLLICELWQRGALVDRWIVNRDSVDEFQYLQHGEEIRVRPVGPKEILTPEKR